jgi:hypothetical protein
MATAAVAKDLVERPTCWCCGNTFNDSDLTRLNVHPEVGVCAGCAHWLWRRASYHGDGGRGPAAQTRRAVARARGRVMRAGAHDWPVVGPLLRRLDHHLP